MGSSSDRGIVDKGTVVNVVRIACTYVKDEFAVVVTYASCVLLNYVIMHLNYKLPYEIPLCKFLSPAYTFNLSA